MYQDRRDFIKTILIGTAGIALFPNLSFGQTASSAEAWKTQMPKILARIKPPKFRKKDFLITKYGAVEGGTELCTGAFKKAIDTCSKSGGGRVVVPKGTFLTGAIHLKSNVNLFVSEGATIKFSKESKDYLPVVRTRWEGMDLMGHSAFIYAFEQTNIAVTGSGTLDGQGKDSFWKWHGNARYGGGGYAPGTISQRADRARLYEMMDKNVPIEQRVFGEGTYLRPNFITPFKCKNVLIEGVKIVDSPMWEVHPVLCENVIVRKLWISSHGPNNDGCDPESCRDVLIEDCFFDTGDDCIAIKSGRNDDGRRAGAPTENIIVRGCTMKDGHGGITVGSEISGGVRNLFAENCKLDSPNLDHALRVKNNAQRGGLLENFYFRNITVGQVAHAVITIDFNYEEGAKGGHTPVMRNFVVENLTSGKSEYGVDIQGLEKGPVENVNISNSAFDKVEKGNIVKNLHGIKLSNFKINGKVENKLS